MHDHRMAMVGAGIVTLLLSVALFGTLPLSFFPPTNSDYSRVNITLPPGSTLKQTEAVVDRVAAIVAKDPTVERVFERINVGTGRVNVVLKKDREITSTEFERNLSPTLAAVPDARVSFQSQKGGGPDADSRDIMLYLGGDDPEQLTAVANQIAKEMETVPGLRAPRVGSQLAQPEITIKPRFDLAADLGVTTAGAEPDDPHRDAWRHRAEQRQILAVRPPGADPGVACRKTPGATCRRSKTCRCRRRAAARCR